MTNIEFKFLFLISCRSFTLHATNPVSLIHADTLCNDVVFAYFWLSIRAFVSSYFIVAYFCYQPCLVMCYQKKLNSVLLNYDKKNILTICTKQNNYDISLAEVIHRKTMNPSTCVRKICFD